MVYEPLCEFDLDGMHNVPRPSNLFGVRKIKGRKGWVPDADNFESHLAIACMTADHNTKTEIVNIDQSTTSTGGKRDLLRDKDGRIRMTRSVPIPNVGTNLRFETIAMVVDPETVEEGERQLQERVDLVKKCTKRWIEALLKAKGIEDTLEAKWKNISFITLKEYLDMPEHKDEWEGRLFFGDWI